MERFVRSSRSCGIYIIFSAQAARAVSVREAPYRLEENNNSMSPLQQLLDDGESTIRSMRDRLDDNSTNGVRKDY